MQVGAQHHRNATVRLVCQKSEMKKKKRKRKLKKGGAREKFIQII
jgi:hypothetical protein